MTTAKWQTLVVGLALMFPEVALAARGAEMQRSARAQEKARLRGAMYQQDAELVAEREDAAALDPERVVPAVKAAVLSMVGAFARGRSELAWGDGTPLGADGKALPDWTSGKGRGGSRAERFRRGHLYQVVWRGEQRTKTKIVNVLVAFNPDGSVRKVKYDSAQNLDRQKLRGSVAAGPMREPSAPTLDEVAPAQADRRVDDAEEPLLSPAPLAAARASIARLRAAVEARGRKVQLDRELTIPAVPEGATVVQTAAALRAASTVRQPSRVARLWKALRFPGALLFGGALMATASIFLAPPPEDPILVLPRAVAVASHAPIEVHLDQAPSDVRLGAGLAPVAQLFPTPVFPKLVAHAAPKQRAARQHRVASHHLPYRTDARGRRLPTWHVVGDRYLPVK